MTKPSTAQKESLITNLCHSKVLHTESYQNLLQYLYECHLREEIPSETEIAREVFHKDKGYNPVQDSSVRVYISNLRKKLKEYFTTEGRDEDFRVIIPKGVYKLEFSRRTNRSPLYKNPWLMGGLVTAYALIVTVMLLVSRGNQKIPESDAALKPIVQPIWSDLLGNKFPTILSLEHIFTFHQQHEASGRWRLVHDYQVLGEDDLRRDPYYNVESEDILPSNWLTVSAVSATSLSQILPYFIEWGAEYSIKLTSELTWDDINTHNIVFVGLYDRLGKLEHFLPPSIQLGSGESDELEGHQVRVTGEKVDTVYSRVSPIFSDDNYARDYLLFGKLPGPNRNMLFLVSSFTSLARRMVIESLTGGTTAINEQLTADMSDIAKRSRYFVTLLEIYGYQRTGLDYGILHTLTLPDTTGNSSPMLLSKY